MSIDMSQFFQVFFDETREHLETMESLLLAVNVAEPSLEDLNAIFRAAHSIKGGAGTFGFTDMIELTHILETLLDRLRKEELTLANEMVDAFLAAGDALSDQVACHQNGTLADPALARTVAEHLRALTGEGGTAPKAPAGAPKQAVEQGRPTSDANDLSQWFAMRIEFDASPASSDVEVVLAGLAEIGRVEIVQQPHTNDAQANWHIRLLTAAREADVIEAFSFLLRPDQVRVSSTPCSEPEAEQYGFFESAPGMPGDDPGYGFLEPIAETLATPVNGADGDGYGFFVDITPAAEAPQPATPSAGSAGAAGRRASDQPGSEGARAGQRAADKVVSSAQGDASSIRVSVEKVDQLINLVGELVITQAMLAQAVGSQEHPANERLLNGIAQLARNTRDLQDSVMTIRMMPIAFIFSRFPRLVRELAGKLGKQVELKTVGEGTELDKSLIEKVADPLTHLIRNSLDHGVETPDKRIAAGKPAMGTITLRASHQGGNIVIEIADDGAGLNRERILAKARERGMQVSDSMADQDVWLLIFEAGFSTAEQVTDVSGRGVGMDVVKRNIHSLGGRVEIDSAAGLGTRISIRLPLTLAILDGMSIAVGDEVFIVPLTYIVESLQPRREDVKSVTGAGRVVHVRGDYLPVVSLHEVFGIAPRHGELHKGILLILEANGGRTALFVDELLGQHQVVIKSLETNYRKVNGISGATIMGDGRVALILDVGSVVGMQPVRRAKPRDSNAIVDIDEGPALNIQMAPQLH